VTQFRWWRRWAVILPAFVGAIAGTDAAQPGAPQTLQNRAPHTLHDPDEDPGRYWTEERMQDAKPFPMPQASDQSNDRPPLPHERGPIESAPAAPPLLPAR
jgi:hypothetical protein